MKCLTKVWMSTVVNDAIDVVHERSGREQLLGGCQPLPSQLVLALSRKTWHVRYGVYKTFAATLNLYLDNCYPDVHCR